MMIDNKYLLKEIEKLIQKLFDDKDIKLKTNTIAKDIQGWDSLAHVNIVLSLEKKFNFRFNPKDIYNFQNIGELIEIIKEHINEKN